jgi:type II secretory pathway pseudopilin PulG
MVMFSIVLMGVSMTVVGKNWSVAVKREREAELIFRGNRIKAAIEAFAADHEVSKALRPNRYPLSLEQLTQKKPKRYLPLVYKDPIIDGPFELIKINGEVRGVRSTSKDEPFDKVRFKNASTYSQIVFQADSPQTANCQPGGNQLNPLNPLNQTGCASPPQRPIGFR